MAKNFSFYGTKERKTLVLENASNGAFDSKYHFTGDVIFQSSMTTDTAIILAASLDGKEKASLDFLIDIKSCENLIEYLQGMISFANSRNDMQNELLETFAVVSKQYNDEFIESLNISLDDVNPRGSKDLEKAPLGLRFSVVYKLDADRTKYAPVEDFLAIIYVTGVLAMDRKVWDIQLPHNLPINYCSKLIRRGEKKLKAAQSDALKSMDERMNK